jgi:hypothetical protein
MELGAMDAETITAIGAAVIVLAALIVSVVEGTQNRKHNRLSVRPCLRIDYSTYTGSPVEVSASNNGTGPAVIRGFSVRVDGTQVQSDDLPLAAAAAKRLGIEGPHDSYTPETGDSIAAGEPAKDWLVIRNSPEEIEKGRELRRQLRRIEFSIEYASDSTATGKRFSTIQHQNPC